jgi:hypothetical protein
MKTHSTFAVICAAFSLQLFSSNVRSEIPAPVASTPASSDPNPCVRTRAAVRSPIEIAFGSPGAVGLAEFGSTPSPCSYRGFSVGGRMGLLVATSSFYGAIDAQANLSGTYAWSEDTWATLSFDAVRFRTAINATVVTAPVDTGAATLTVNNVLARDPNGQVTGFVRLLLPTDFSLRYATRLGAEFGMSFVWAPHPAWSFFTGFSLPITTTTSAGGTLITFTPRATVDVAWRMARAFELLLGVEARAGLELAGLEYFAPRVGLRFHLTQAWFAELNAMVPMLGVERSLARAALNVGLRF